MEIKRKVAAVRIMYRICHSTTMEDNKIFSELALREF